MVMSLVIISRVIHVYKYMLSARGHKDPDRRRAGTLPERAGPLECAICTRKLLASKPPLMGGHFRLVLCKK